MAHLTAAKVAKIKTALEIQGTRQNAEIRDAFTSSLEELTVKEFELTPANIIAMSASPIQVVAKQGPGTVIEFVSAVVILDYTAPQFTGGGLVSFREETSGTILSTTIAASVITAASDSITKVTDTAVTLTANKGIFISNATAAFAAGASHLTIRVAYRVHSTGL